MCPMIKSIWDPHEAGTFKYIEQLGVGITMQIIVSALIAKLGSSITF